MKHSISKMISISKQTATITPMSRYRDEDAVDVTDIAVNARRIHQELVGEQNAAKQ